MKRKQGTRHFIFYDRKGAQLDNWFILHLQLIYVSRQQDRTSALALVQARNQVVSKYLVFPKFNWYFCEKFNIFLSFNVFVAIHEGPRFDQRMELVPLYPND